MIYNKAVQDALAQGYSLDQIKQLAISEYNDALSQGFKPEDARRVLKETYGLSAGTAQEDLDEAYYLASLAFAPIEENTQKSESSNATESNTKKAKNIGEAFLAGAQNSTMGLVVRGKLPAVTVSEDAPLTWKVASAVSQGIGDIPSLVAGGFLGGLLGAAVSGPAAPIAGTAMAGAGAGGFTEFLRHAYTTALANGSAQTFGEYTSQFIGNFLAGGKGAAMGAILGPTAKAIGPFATRKANEWFDPAVHSTLNAIAQTGISLSAEAAAMAQTMAAFEGRFPSASDFMVAGVTLGAFKTSGVYSRPLLKAPNLFIGKFLEAFDKYGVTPQDVQRATLIDPTIKERLMALNQPIIVAERAKYFKVQALLSPHEIKVRGLEPGTVYTDEAIAKAMEASRAEVIETSVKKRIARETKNKRANLNDKNAELTEEEITKIREQVTKDVEKSSGLHVTRLKQHAGKWLYGSKQEAARKAQEAAGETKLASPEAFYEEVWLPKKGFYFRFRGNADALMAKVVKEYMKTPYGRAALETLDPQFFKENPNWWEGRKTVADEKLVPTARKLFENPSPEFVYFLKNHIWDTELAARLANRSYKDMLLLEHNFLTDNGPVTGVKLDWAGIIHDQGAGKGGTRYFIFDPKRIKLSAKDVTGETPYDKALQKFENKISIGERPTRTWSEVKDNILYHTVDSFHALNTGAAQGKHSEAYVDAIVSNGAAGRATFMIEYGMLNANGEKVGRSLEEILTGLRNEGGNNKEFSIYLAAKYFKEMHDHGISTAMDPDTVVSILKGPNAALYEKYAQQAKEYDNQLLDYSLETGLISKSRYDKLRRETKTSIPLDKLIEAFEPELREEALRTNTKAGAKETDQAKMARLFGMEKTKDGKLYLDPLESLVRSTYLVTRLSMQNSAKKTAAETYGVAIDSPTAKAPNMTTISYLDQGKVRRRAVPKAIREATLSMDSGTFQMYNAALRGLAKGTSIFRIGTTSTPAFAVKNFFIDQLVAWIQSPKEVAYCPFLSAFKGIGEIFRTKVYGQESMYTEWLKDGGSQASLASLGRNFTQETIKDIQRVPATNMIKDPAKYWKDIASLLLPSRMARGAYQMLQGIAEYSDQATRVGMYLEARKAGYSGKESAFLSRRSTVDFSRAGATIKSLNSIVAFLNARVQGISRIVETAKADPADFMSKVVRGIIVPSMLLELVKNDIIQSNQNPEDPNFTVAQELAQAAEWETTAYWLLPITSIDSVIKIPKPHEFGVLAAIGESYIDYMYKLGSADESTFLDQIRENGIVSGIYDTLVPNLMPSPALPVFEVMTNYSFFTGGNIIPSYLKNQVPALQYRPGTSTFAKWVSEQIFKIDPEINSNAMTRFVSPQGIDHLVRGWTGAVGQTLVQALSKIVEASGAYKVPVEPAKTLADMPFFKTFMVKYPTPGARDIMKFNAEANTMQQRWNSITAGMRSPDPHKQVIAQTLIKSVPYANFQKMRSTLSQMSKAVELIYLANNDPESKRLQIENIYIQMARIATQGRKAIKRIEKEMADARREQ